MNERLVQNGNSVPSVRSVAYSGNGSVVVDLACLYSPTMLGLGGYGSGSDSESEDTASSTAASKSHSQSLPTQSSKSASSSLSSSLPPPKAKKKVGIALPSLKPLKDEDDVAPPPAKKARLETGAGVSSLLSMLPAPKQKGLPKAAAPARVLGGGASNQPIVSAPPPPDTDAGGDDDSAKSNSLPLLLPPSLKKGRANVSLEDDYDRPRKVPAKPTVNVSVKPVVNEPSAPAVDFFGLGAATSSKSGPSIPSASSSSVKITSAPSVPTFEIPEPTPEDEYPGYYKLPSGQWAQHDVAYYNQFAAKWQKEYNAHIRALEKGKEKGFERMQDEDMAEVDAASEMERAKREVHDLEERRALTMGGEGNAAPKVKLTASKSSGIARSRHQLATMLHEAYNNREALEEKIAQGRRNRKEAGSKYGF
ncbi:hypothetical protein CYLTODRAFT_435502 [Cylindrobasidium torrendii FP15055 ss-10]|uniref:Mitotic checkpoint regulator, MAD2B-interacting-domain-containing protein n=1 Tax=Cylindrobasidium torrendii FP15055 ss-10 TaxID=1314674 RepID=A0A0D7BMW5_9AGAR|nr:hypothetical protein CYLTODRAFT_435502 [Cylindrobasidium torrendii FP15055 ss-10]